MRLRTALLFLLASTACASFQGAPVRSQDVAPVLPLVVENGELLPPPQPIRPVLRQLFINEQLKALNFDGIDDNLPLCISVTEDVAQCVPFGEFREWLLSRKKS